MKFPKQRVNDNDPDTPINAELWNTQQDNIEAVTDELNDKTQFLNTTNPFNPSAIVDYPVEEGVTNNTRWKKFKNGDVEFTREFGAVPQGGVTWPFPFELISVPYVDASTSTGTATQAILCNAVNITKSSALIYFMNSFTTRVAVENVVGIVKGRWK